MKNADTAQLFENAFPNTLDTTVQYHNAEQVDTFIITGISTIKTATHR